MSFIRPEARAQMWRWREVLAGIGLIVLGAFWAVGRGPLVWIGLVLLVVGAVAVFIGIQRARFRVAGQGPGVVQMDEGQLSYFGPLSGGMIETGAIERVVLDNTARPAHWVIQAGDQTLHIPVSAEGAEALFDAFGALPGLRTERMLAELNARRPHAVVIWERAPLRPPHALLH